MLGTWDEDTFRATWTARYLFKHHVCERQEPTRPVTRIRISSLYTLPFLPYLKCRISGWGRVWTCDAVATVVPVIMLIATKPISSRWIITRRQGMPPSRRLQFYFQATKWDSLLAWGSSYMGLPSWCHQVHWLIYRMEAYCCVNSWTVNLLC